MTPDPLILKAFEKAKRLRKEVLPLLIKQQEEKKVTARELTEAISWVASIIVGLTEETHTRISSAVTKCLRYVFEDEAYAFNVVFSGKGKVHFELVRDGEQYDLEDVGGGVIDVVAFALRIAVLMTSSNARVLILDEPFRFVSKEYRSRVSSLLTLLSEEFKVQIIMITHAQELISGEVIKLKELIDGSSTST